MDILIRGAIFDTNNMFAFLLAAPPEPLSITRLELPTR
jgi:hypothetical protein